mgnify:CR=1 FL=1
MALLGILASMSSAVTSIGAGFSSIGQIASNVWNTIKQKWDEWVVQPIEDFFDWAETTWDDFSGWMTDAFDFVMTEFLTKDYWTGPDGVLTNIYDMFPDWDELFSFVPEGFLTKAYWTELFTWSEMPWESWGDFELPEWLTWDYYFGSSVFKWPDMPWESWGDFTLPAWLTWDYYFGEGGVFDFDIKWGELFSWVPDGIFTSDYWFGNGGVFDWTMPWENWSFSWSDFLPDWSWDDVIPEGLGDLFSIDGDITQTISNGFSGTIDAFKVLINDNLINPINSVMNYDLPLLGSLTSVTGIPNIPMLAKGGIVNKPTLAMIGEDGPEAVVPLNQRNNPGGAGMGGTVNVTVNAGGITDRTDKRTLAREIGNMIQNELARNIGGTTMRGR